jgi:hypothetical protein
MDMDEMMTIANFEIGQRHKRAERDRMIRNWRAQRAELTARLSRRTVSVVSPAWCIG